MSRLIPTIQPHKGHSTEFRARKDSEGLIQCSITLTHHGEDDDQTEIGRLEGIIVPDTNSFREFYDHMDNYSSDAEVVASALEPSLRSGRFYDRWETTPSSPFIYVDRVEIATEHRGKYKGYLLMHALMDFLTTLGADHVMVGLLAAPILTEEVPMEVYEAKCRSLAIYWETFGFTKTRYKTQGLHSILVHNMSHKFPEGSWARHQGLGD